MDYIFNNTFFILKTDNNETHFPAEQSAPQKETRIPGTHGDTWRAQSYQASTS